MNMCIYCLLHEASVVHLICIVSSSFYILLHFIWFSSKLLLCLSDMTTRL
jgi:hypothetical protein